MFIINPYRFAGYSSLRSLRGNGSNKYATWTPSTNTAVLTGTISVFFKQNTINVNRTLVCADHVGAVCTLTLLSGNQLYAQMSKQGGGAFYTQSTATYTDTTSWHHFCMGWDASLSGTNRWKVEYDGTEITSWSTDQRASWSSVTATAWSYNGAHNAFRSTNGTEYFDGWIDDFAYVEGTKLDSTSFRTAGGKPKDLSALSFGTNGFWLKFEDNTSTTTMGQSSANSNNFTLTNFTTSDSSTDVP